ncbi:MAG: porin [Proteobacteria bacterium]|nr:porin [Pseudomonadota bacterium]
MNIKTILKSSVAATALFAVAVPMSTTANAADDTLSSGQKTKLKVSGYVSRAIWHADDGTSDKTFFTGGAGTQTRVRWIASGTLNENVTAGATIEIELPKPNNEAASVLQSGARPGNASTDSADKTNWDIRHEYVWVNHKKFGKVSLGQTDHGFGGSYGQTFSGTGSIDSDSGVSFGNGLTFVNTSAAAKAVSTNTTGAVFSGRRNNSDRGDLIRYDTPKFMGFDAKTSLHDNGTADVSVGYGGKFGSFAVKSRAGYVNKDGDVSHNFTAAGSIAVQHDSGLNASFGAYKVNFAGPRSKSALSATINSAMLSGPQDGNNLGGRDDAYSYNFRLGYNAAKLVGVGPTSFGLQYVTSQNEKENDGDAESWSIGVVQKFSALGMDVGLVYSNYAYSAESETTVGTKTAETYDDIDVIALQTVFNF